MSVVSEQTFCIFGCCGLLCLAAILITLIVGVVRVNDIRDDIVRARAAAARLTRAQEGDPNGAGSLVALPALMAVVGFTLLKSAWSAPSKHAAE